MKKLGLIFILLTGISVYAQQGTLKGKIITDKNETLEGVNVVIPGTQYGAATLSDGSFEIKNLPFSNYTLEISLIGYSKKKIYIDFDAATKPLIIVLAEEPVQAQQVVVSAAKYEQRIQDLPVSTTIIQPDFIDKNNYLTFDEMLRNVPGVQMNLEQPSIRGSSGYSKGTGARVLVAVNGIQMYSGDTGEIVWELIPMADIERIEIIKGPASSLYGSTAIGGVINIITKSAVKNSITHFRSYFGAYDKPAYDIWKWNNNLRTLYGVELTHSNAVGNFAYTLSFKKFDNMGYRQNDYTKRNLGYLKLNYDFSAQDKLTLFADFLNMDRGNFLYWKDSRNALVPKDEDNGNTVQSNRLFTGLIYHHSFNKNFFGEVKTSYYNTKFDGYGVELTESVANLIRNEVILNAELSDEWNGTMGAELSYSKVSSNIFMSPKFLGSGAYIQAGYKGIQNLTANFGIRYDYIKLDTLGNANAVTPKAGLNYKLTKDFVLRASFGTGFRAPTPSEVFTSAGVGGGIDIKQNPNLKSETSISFEAGARYDYLEDLSLDLALYQTEYNNFIEATLTKEAKIQFINLSKARIQGLEFNFDWRIIPGLFKISWGYNYMWSRDLENNVPMKYRPRNIVNARFQYTPMPFEFEINYRYASRVEAIDKALTQPPFALVVDGDKRVPIYTTNLSAGYNFLIDSFPAKIFLIVKNIFNYNYVEFIGNIAPIRNYSLSWEIFF